MFQPLESLVRLALPLMRAINQAPYIMIVANSLMQENCRVNEERLHSHPFHSIPVSTKMQLITKSTDNRLSQIISLNQITFTFDHNSNFFLESTSHQSSQETGIFFLAKVPMKLPNSLLFLPTGCPYSLRVMQILGHHYLNICSSSRLGPFLSLYFDAQQVALLITGDKTDENIS